MIAFIMRPIICPQLLNYGVKLGKRSLYIVTYESEQRQQQKGVKSSSRESIQGDIGELIPSSPYQG